MSRTTTVSVLGLIAALTLAGCTAPEEKKLGLKEINAEFSQPIEPAWEVDAEGIYGEPAIGHGLVAMYLQDAEVGLRIAVYSAKDGELLWDHVASPGGAWGVPLFDGKDSTGRSYPIPTIQPLLVDRESEQEPVIVFFERSKDDSITPDDILHVVDARTGDELEVALPDYDKDEDYLDYLNPRPAGTLGMLAYSPGWVCKEGPTVCFDEPEGGHVEINLGSLEARTTERLMPEDPDYEMSRDWGADFISRSGDEGPSIIRFADGEVLWERTTRDLLGSQYASPPTYVEFIEVGDLYLIQGLRGITSNLDTGELSLDIVEARTLAAVNKETGETVWTLDGADSLCYPVADFEFDVDTKVLPVCLVHEGSFVFAGEEFAEYEEPVASIAGINVADGSIAWEVEAAASQPIGFMSRLSEADYASQGRFAVAPTGFESLEHGLIDLTNGKWAKSPKKATFVCEAERDDIELEFEGSIFTGGSNPIALGYPAGWYTFACDREMEPTKTWSKGAVRTAGYAIGGGMTLLVTETGLVVFDLEAE